MIAVIDYKAGNLTSVMKALDALGCQATVTADPDGGAEGGEGHPSRGWSFSSYAAAGGHWPDCAQSVIRLPGACPSWGSAWVCNGCSRAAQKPRPAKGLSVLQRAMRAVCPGVKVPHVGWNEVRVDPPIAPDARRRGSLLRLLHPLLPGSRRQRNSCSYRIRRPFFRAPWSAAT